jgi:hypothetical protein
MAPTDAGNEIAVNAVALPCSPRYARIVTVIVLLVAGTGVAVANLSSESATVDFLKKTYFAYDEGERPFGWPLVWYWRTAGNLGDAFQWPISRLSAPRLFANAALWLAMLAATVAACRWLLREHFPRFERPRVSTLVALIVVAAPTVLANLSHDDSPLGDYYGWPLIWYGHIPAMGSIAAIFPERWEFSALAFFGNLLAWLLLLAVTWLAWQWLAGRYQPRLRWNLKTMLAVVGVAAVICAWLAGARSRAEKQDALIEFLGGEKFFVDEQPQFYDVDRWGPRWLDLLGADRFRRSIVAANVEAGDDDIEELLERLAQLPDLRCLDISSAFTIPSRPRFTRRMGETLGGMRQLRMLNVECENAYGYILTDEVHECIAAVGKLAQLERLGIHLWEENIDDLANLNKLTNLSSLELSIIPFADWEDSYTYGGADTSEEADERENNVEPRTLVRLPPLPRLEVLTLHEWELGDENLDRLAGFPRLKSLDLSWTTVTAAGLAKLALLESLKELAINEDVATAAGIQALTALKRLKAVHIAVAGDAQAHDAKMEKIKRRAEIAGVALDESVRPAALALDDGSKLVVLPGELEGLRRALAALRQSHPGIVIDAAYEEFEGRTGVGSL